MITKTSRMLMFLLGLALISSVWSQAVRAQDNYRAKATKVTVTEPMQVPGMVLAAGEYVFRLNDSDANRHIVHIFNADETKLVTTVLAIPNARLNPTDKGIMTYEERPVGQPVALAAWFYSGEGNGQQFVYPKSKAEELSSLNRVQVPSTGNEQAYVGVETSDRSVSSQTPEPTYSASAQPEVAAQAPTTTTATARPEPVAAANPTPVPAQQGVYPDASPDAQAQLPNTASVLPLAALLGASLMAVALLLKLMVRT